jgi:O-antigen ligase
MKNEKPIMSSFWLVSWSCMLALGWLLPNHYYPWLSFHSDAWVALSVSLASVAVIWRSRQPIAWHRITILVALLLCLPWLQHVFGVMPLLGNAWISSAYLFGLLLAMLTGAQWEARCPAQLGDGLFLALGVAALVSVSLQLQQWWQLVGVSAVSSVGSQLQQSLQLDGLGLWTMGSETNRPHANLGQPNQLATLLLWGLLAAAWGLIRKRIGAVTALLMMLFLLFGIALTGSRTAWLGVALIVAATWWWRQLWASSRWPWVTTGLGLYFAICVVSVGWLHQASLGQSQLDSANVIRLSGGLRPLAWTSFLDAAWQRSWFGYGWNQSALAHMAVASEHAPLHSVFTYAHNLFLDLVLWCGIPLGLLISVVLVWWFWQRLRAIQSAENAVLMLVLLVVANHAMFELPLYYAYFLLPTGLVMGTLHTRLGVPPIVLMGRRAALALWLAATTLLALIIRDYSRVEPSYQTLRLEWSQIKITLPVGPPDVWLLTQWHDYIKYARIEPKAGLSAAELDWMRNVTGLYPNAILMHKLATTLALNQHPEEAQLWLKRMCKVIPESECFIAEKIWARQSLRYPEIAAIPWPVKAEN